MMRFVCAFLTLALLGSRHCCSATPNIVLIMVDDVGFSDLGCYGSEIRTPNVDRLATEGLRFRQFYNNAICHLTRASLLTGLYPRREPGGGPRLSPNMVTIGEVLQDAGYGTVLSGKWHLGRTSPNRPIDRGFDEYYGLLDGCCNQFNPAQRDPEFEGGRYRVWGHNADLVTEFPDNFYATDAITDHAIKHIRRFAAAGKPFFAHVCYTAAHSPMHAKPQDIARYRGRYDGGWDALRLERHKRQLELGIVDAAWHLPPREPEAGVWADNNLKAWQASLMEVYAAMIDCVDQNVGRIMASLNEAGVAENTIVMFLSDNGGCAEQAGGDDPTNIPGPKEHYVSCGPGWGYAQTTPFRRYKAWMHEGGISTPLVVHWPGQVKAATLTNQVGHLIDLLPTCLEIAGAKYPVTRHGATIDPVEGKSLLPIFRGQTREPHASLYWEWSGNRAVRQGDWKLAWDNTVNRWELYNLAADRTETDDHASSDPQRVEQMSRDWVSWAARTGVDKTTPKPIRLKPSNVHHFQGMLPDELQQLLAGKQALGRADRAHTTGPQGAAPLETAQGVFARQQAGDVAGIEGIASAGAAHEVDRIDASPHAQRVGQQHGAGAAAGNADGGGPRGAKLLRLLDGIFQPGDDRRFIGVGQEHVRMRQHAFKAPPMIARTGEHHIQHGLYSGRAGLAKQFRQRFVSEMGHQQIPAHIQHLRSLDLFRRNILDAEDAIGPQRVNEPPVLTFHIDDQRAGGADPSHFADALHAHSGGCQSFADELTERVSPDAPDHADGNTEPGQTHRHIRGAAADRQGQLVGQQQFAGARHMVDWSAKVVGHQNAGAQAGR